MRLLQLVQVRLAPVFSFLRDPTNPVLVGFEDFGLLSLTLRSAVGGHCLRQG